MNGLKATRRTKKIRCGLIFHIPINIICWDFSSANGRERQLGSGVPWQSGNAPETGKRSMHACIHVSD